MTSGTSIKERCRLCYTRLKDSSSLSSSHHKFWCSQQHQHRIVNIYKHRPYSYHDFIVRYLCINLPNKTLLDPYSQVICGSCADALEKLHSTFRAFEQTQKSLRSKYRKTSQIIRYQINRPIKTTKPSNVLPKRQSKRKGAPKHIDQSINHMKKATNALQLLVRLRSPHRDENEIMETTNISPNKRKDDILTESTNHKKRLKRLTKDSESSETSSNNESTVNLFKPSTSIETSGTTSNRSINSVKGNHIERIAVSLLSESINGNSEHSMETHPSKTRTRRKTTTSYTPVATILSPSLDENDDENLSNNEASNDSSTVSPSTLQSTTTNVTIPNVNKHLSATISTTPTAEGLTITAINQTGQKQVFMAKQLGNLKKYQCGLCEKIVTNIQIHVRRHTNDKPYPCTYCEKRFTNSGDLQIHVRIHTGEKPYACPLCLKSYRTIGNFNSHVKTHDSGTRPHRCELCNQTFSIPKDWYSHLRSSHRSRIPPSTLTSPNTTTTVTQPLFSNTLSSQQQHSEVFVPNKVKLEPINRSQLIIKTSSNDDQEPVNMTKKENSNDIDEDEDEDEDVENDDEDEEQHPSTRNLLSNVTSSVVHV